MGGGTVLILFLTIFKNFSQHSAQATNLIFFIPTSIAVILINLKNKSINLKIGTQVALTGIVGAFVGAVLSSKIDVNMLKKFFGIFLAFIAINEIYSYIKMYIYREKRHTKNELK